jgi:hypothetical protein
MKNVKKNELPLFLSDIKKNEDKKDELIKKLTRNKEVISAIMKLSDEKSKHNLIINKETPSIKEETTSKNKIKKTINFNVFKKIKIFFKNIIFKYLIQPEIKRIENEKLQKEQDEKDILNKDIIKRFYDINIEDRKIFNENLERIRKESGGKSYGKVPMLFSPDDCLTHNENPERLSLPSLKDLVKYENERTTKVLRQQSDPNFTKNKIDLMMKKRILIDEIK